MIAPQVTVAVPSFNQGQFLDETLSSIFQQEVPVEVFVLDGGSTDNSLDIIRKWESKLAGWRSYADQGQAEAINDGIAQGSAPFVCWLNSDDHFYPDGLKNLIKTLMDQPAKQFVYANCWSIIKSGRKLSPYLTMPFSPRLFANFCFIAQPATLIRRAAWEQSRGVNEDMQMAFDYDLWWRLYTEYGKPAFCKNFVAATRMHKDSKTTKHTELHYKESIETVNRNWGCVPIKWRLALPAMKIIHHLNK